ncbi:MFS transporter [Sinosporangium siamense]|uniref:MFS transporter n=1 Tax=Sinosporangium siamense TaxID=1367973 RepID=A0A919RE61_9ACTN|nr:MFS transporter [Sinosporangium siamense]GII91973.1 MFS transporter [Sinosporangium siamense]
MVGPYRGLFNTPGAKGFVISGFVGRLPMSMLGISIVLLISALTNSYGTAGAIAATVSVAFAVSAPLSGRLVDRFGQARVLIPITIAHGAALIGLMLLASSGAPIWTLFATGVLVGATAVSLGSMVRARWSYLTAGDSKKLHTAFSFESVMDEMIFVGGPALATALATTVSEYAGLVVVLLSTTIGVTTFALQRGTEPPVRPRRSGGGTSPILIPGVAVVSCVFLAMGSVFGSVDLITVAFAEEEGSKAAAGLMLGAFAGGSLVSGIWFGARQWRISLRSRFVRALGFFAVGVVPIVFVGHVALMAVALFLAGLAISPTIITGYALVERLVPNGLLTEGMAWISTAVGFGVAIGAWAGGRLTDMFGATNAYGFALICALLAATVGLAGSALLRTPKETSPAQA